MNTVIPILPQEASVLVQQEEAILIDVREKDEFLSAYVKNSILCPLSKIKKANPAILKKLAEHKNTNWIFFCRNGVRALQAATALASQAENNVYHVEGGLVQWKKEGLPVVQRGTLIRTLIPLLSVGAFLLCYYFYIKLH